MSWRGVVVGGGRVEGGGGGGRSGHGERQRCPSLYAPLRPQRKSDVLGAPHGSPDCLLQSAGGGAASSLPPTPPLPTLLLSPIRRIQAMRVGNCCGGGGGGAGSILRVRLCNCCNGRGGDADAAATAEAAGPGRTRRQLPPHRLHLPDCDDAAAPVQAARHGRIAMISQESPLVIENLSLNCPCMFELFGPSAEARDCGPGVGQGPWHGVQRPAGHRFCMAIVAPAVTHALRRRRLTRPVGICEEPVEAPQLRAARRAHCRAGARFGAAGADAVRRGRKDQLHRCLLQVRVDWPSLSLWVTVSVIGRSSWLPPPPPL